MSKKQVYFHKNILQLWGGTMKRLLSLLTVVTFVAIPNYSYAQNAELVLEEVVVTATKKEENVQDIAQTVNAVSGSTLDDYQIRDLSELAQVVSGVEFTKIDPRRATIIMRGQKLDPDGGNDQPIQGYIDEVPLRAQDVFSQMYDTERVEILKVLKVLCRELLVQLEQFKFILDLLKWEVAKKMATLRQCGPIT